MEPLVGIIVLNYKNVDDTEECIGSLKKIDYKNYFIVIVDNNSQDGSFEKLSKLYPELTVLEIGENRGYAAGNNFGIKQALQKGADYICILNNDVVVEPNFLGKLVSYMEQNPKVGITGANICEYYNKEVVQSTGFVINYHTARTPGINKGKKQKNIINKAPLPCDAVCGACMLIRKEVISKVGLIPEIYFLFYEETEWCVRTKKAGFEIVSIMDAIVYHKGSATIKKTKGLSDYYMQRNSVLFERRNASILQNIIFFMFITARGVYHILRGDKLSDYVNVKALKDGYLMPAKD